MHHMRHPHAAVRGLKGLSARVYERLQQSLVFQLSVALKMRDYSGPSLGRPTQARHHKHTHTQHVQMDVEVCQQSRDRKQCSHG